ncbi:DSCL protein, partial [Acromyrmex insinuator]
MWRDPPGGGYKKPIHVAAMLLLAVFLTLTTVISAEDASMGPVFVKEPPNRIDFSNGTGAVVECQARGNPQPDIIWVRSDGNTAVGDVPGLRQVMPNGNLVFPPFRAEDYRQEVHAQVYTCLARSPAGSVHSRDVNVRAVVAQYYDTDVNKEYAIRGNSAILKCVVPSFVADFVKVLSWHTDQGEEFVPGDDFVVHQYYQSEVNNEYVIRGNAAILKCSIPSFVAEFVQVIGWQDDQGNSFDPDQDNVVTQPYNPEILTEYVIRGNSAILKCSIPSYIAEFVTVEAWIREDGEVYLPTDLTIAQVVSQFYVTEAENEYVIRANSAIMKCKIPSFVSEFVQVDQWMADDGTIYTSGQEYVVQQFYETRVIDEFVLRGNTATLKCLVPSFVADFVDVIEWQDEDGSTYTVNSQQEKVVAQYFEVQVYDQFAIRGNAAIFKCQVPSFVADHVDVVGWIDSNGGSYVADAQSYVVGQRYAVNVMDEHVLRGNAAIIKCHIPSFVAEFVEVDSWIEDETTDIYPSADYDGKYLVLPSGELHIRDVGPEDGYKTYQCRTKHRLTGETRLSATKGRLVITEPVGSVRPKIPSTDDVRGFRTLIGDSPALMCPAQGFPVPLYREVLCRQLEPVGSKAPAFAGDAKLSLLVRKANMDVSLPCNAQGHPPPVSSPSEVRRLPLPAKQRYLYWRGKQMQKSVFRAMPKAILLQCLEPVGSKAPAVTGIVKGVLLEIGARSAVVLFCPAQGYPVPSFSQWERRGRNSRVTIASTHLYALREVHRVYTVLRRGSPYRRSEPITGAAPKVPPTAKITVLSIASRTAMVMLCQAQANPLPVFRWYKFIEGTSRRQPVQLNERVRQVSGTLIIREARVEDSGKYLCIVNNSVGGESVETVLTVTAPLIAEIEPSTQTIDFGRPATFTCTVQGNPIKTISWLKDGKPLGLEDRVLRIESVKKEDKGMYQCFVRNDQESAQATAELKLGGRFEPPQIRQAFAEETLQPGPSMFLKCVASGNPTPEITWELDGKRLSNTERLQVGQYVTVNGDVVSHLNISSIHTNDGGLYKCIAASKVGAAEHSARLNVYGLPFIRHMDKKAIVAGETLRVTCPVAGYPIESIVWERDTRVLPINRKQKVFLNGTLIIENVERMSDQATYTCVARNAQGYSARGTLEVQVMVAPQILPFAFGDEPASWGELVSITCSVTKGDQPIEISWTFNGTSIDSRDSDVVVASTNRKNSVLTIESVAARHAGDYTCTASNRVGATTYTAHLAVNVAPQLAPFTFGDEAANAGEMATVQCAVIKGDLPIDIIWSFNERVIDIANGAFNEHNYNPDIVISRSSKRISQLTIESVAARHAGEYSCTASNTAGTATHSSVLSVNVPPRIAPFEMADRAVNWGDSVSAVCTVVNGDTPLEITWALNGMPIEENHRISVTTTKRNSLLSIDSASPSHAGTYTCVASNAAGAITYSAELTVNVAPQIAPFDIAEEPANWGDSISVVCAILKGDLPIEITWALNGEPIRPDRSDINILATTRKNSILSIESVAARHAGEYTCSASNKAGATSYSAILTVNVAPEIMPFVIGEEPANWGDTITVTCTVLKGDHPIQIEWAHNGEPISRDHPDISIVSTSKRVSLLTIDAVTARHAGEYTCTASNVAGGTSSSASLAVNVAPHIGPFAISDGPANWGDMVSATCSIMKGDFPVKIVWTFNGKPISLHDSDITITNINKHMSALSIESVAARHAGEYTCVATNRAGNVSHSTILVVNVAPQIFPFTFGDEPINSGEAISATCSILKGDFPMDIAWAFNGEPISVESTDQFSITKSKRLSVLSIDAVAARHAGEYTCTASNKAGASSHTAALAVNVAPQIAPFLISDEPANWGEAVSSVCTVVKGDLPIEVAWALNGEAITKENYGDISISSTSKRVSLMTIEAVSPRHAGEYTCTASNAAGATSYSATLAVNVAPQIAPFSISEEPANWGEQVSAMCSILKGDLPIEIRWSLNGEIITRLNHPDVIITNTGKKTSVLTIESVTARHAGEYSCVASNLVGSVSRSAVLSVNVSPQIAPISFGEEPVNAGDLVSVQCVVTKGDFPLEITWIFDSRPIQSYHGDVIVSDTGKRVKQLIIESVAARHAGEYTCVASNAAGSTSYSTMLNVNVIPKLLPFAFGEEPLNSGQVVTVPCAVVEGDQPLQLRWTLNGHAISPHSGISIVDLGGRGAILSIGSVQATHAGTYTCVAENLAGRHELSADLIVNVAPHLQPFAFDEANSGDLIIVHCAVVKGDTPISLKWLFEGRHLEVGEGVGITALGDRVSALTIPAVRGEHAGEYACVADNPAGSARHSAHLKVNVLPRINPFDFGDRPIYAGQAAQLACMVPIGDTPIEIAWTHEGEPLSQFMGFSVGKLGPRTSILLIEPVTPEHSGRYACVANNPSGRAIHEATLRVHVPPRWILEPTDKAFAQGSDARVECKADGFPKPQVTWKRAAGDTPGDYTDLKLSNPDISVEDGTLSINNIQKTNEGYYLCEAVNGIGSGLSAVILISVQAPPQFEIKLRNQTARRGEPAVLQCEAQGEKPIGILWNMNNKRLDTKSDPRYTIREEILANGVLSDLSIKRTERSDSALFTCVATNAFGSDDTSINMIVQEVPEVPYGLKVLDKSGRSVQLSWAAPYDGNSPIKRYVIEYKISKGSWETDIDRVLVPGSQQNVAGVYNLRPATTYHLRIVAENEIGTSDPSDTVTIITAEEAPTGPPTSIKVDALDQHTLKVTWKPPPREDWNGEILGYYVGYRQSSDKPYMFETVDFSKEDIKEHHLQIANLKTYTQYGVVVQAFNKVGSGPMSEERRQHTAEGVPEQPPHDTTCTTLTSQTIRVSWVSPPLSAANGVITGYKVIYGPSDTWYDENTKDTKITSSSETILHGLKKYTNYSMQVLAFTSGGDGVKSAPIHCQTEQDAPEAPIAIKALVMSSESILISWRPPSQPNGVISQYTVYTKADNTEEPTSQKVPPNQLTHEASGLDKQQRYEFWVTASTNIGEGEASKIVTLGPSVRVPAKIASFDDKFTATYKEDVKLPCLTVGVPAPEVTWKVRGANLQTTERLKQLPEGSLFIKEVDRADAGEYSCYVENSFGHDTVTHQLVVHAPPHSPQVTLTATTTNSLTMKLRPHPTDNAPIHGYTIHYKPEFGDWETVQISSTAQKYTLENLWCGSRYQIYVTAYNGIGIGDPSDILNTRTKGSKPIIPEASKFIEVSTNSISLHLSTWSDGGCPMLYFVVEHKKNWYHLRVTAHNNAGFAVAEYEFATLTVTGGTIAPARELPDVNGGSNDEDPMKIFMANLNLVVPVVAAILVIIVAVIVICVLRGKGHSSDKGTIAPPIRNGGNDNTADVRRYFPWLPSWLDVNVVVPVGATVVVIIVGIVVICVALSRRTRGPEQTRLRDDVVYQQTGVGGATLDKRRSDLRDELGYIAPPNRKLPPVPGSNYNTCDRIKRGGTGSLRSHSTWDPRRHMYEELSHYAPNRRCPPPPPRMGSADGLSHRDFLSVVTESTLVDCPFLGMEDEICPYATFHLLGFREEMDPSKAMQFQTFPHPGNGHSGTMGPPVGHPTNASAHSRSGSQSMPRQNGRYSRVPSQGGGSGTHNVFSPEYDDPANCAPEEDQYGSQYGQYGAPYDHYGSRGSVGRRSVGSARNLPISGSPEPPPPPPRNHQDQNNSSFNDSKESNEISEAECDRDQLVNRNYGVNARGKDGMTTEEMRKLIERSVERE